MDWAQELVSGGVNLVIGLTGVVVGSIITGAGEKSRIRESRLHDERKAQRTAMFNLVDDMQALLKAPYNGEMQREQGTANVDMQGILGYISDNSRLLIERARRDVLDDSVDAKLDELARLRERDVEVASAINRFGTVDDEEPPANGASFSPDYVPPAPTITDEEAQEAENALPLHLWTEMMVAAAKQCAAEARRELRGEVVVPVKGTRRRAFLRFFASAVFGAVVIAGPMLLM